MKDRDYKQMLEVDKFMKNNIDIMESTRLKVTRLSNQLLVGNFSSPHPFTFDDGTVLDAVSDYDSMRLKVNFNETLVEPNEKGFDTISLDFTISDEVWNEMETWTKMWEHNDVDIVLCPLPMIQALQSKVEMDYNVLNSPFRAVRMKDRIKKTVSCNTFTI